MTQYVANRPRRASDENWVLTILGFTVVAVVCMSVVGYFLTRHWDQQEEALRAQQRQLETYRRFTAPPSTRATPPEAVQAQAKAQTQAQQTRARLLSHPSVTPGPGFDRPGVQSTGIRIVDAIDQAQGLR